MKAFSIVILVFALLIGGFYALNTYIYNEKQGEQVTYTATDFVWKIENSPKFKETMPYQNVFLEVGGTNYKVGEYLGCDAKTTSPLEPGEISREFCWFGGAGDEISVFSENGNYIVKARWVQETGPEGSGEPVGPWKVLFSI